MTQDERWQVKYNEVIEFLEEHFNTVMAKTLPWQKNLGH